VTDISASPEASAASPREGEARERIRRAAYELFAEHGYHGTSVREIANRAGMSQGQITYHFGSKAALFRAVATEASDVLDTLARDAARAGDARQRLATLAEQVAERREAQQAFGILVACMFAREVASPVLPLPLDWIRAVTAPDATADDRRSSDE
jgi:AcrR family transcriptional regulator